MKKENKDELKRKLDFITELCNILGGDNDSPKFFKVMKADSDFFQLKSKILKAEVLDDNDELMNKLIEMYQGDIIYLNHLIEQYKIVILDIPFYLLYYYSIIIKRSDFLWNK